jgi:hypothetical protein
MSRNCRHIPEAAQTNAGCNHTARAGLDAPATA